MSESTKAHDIKFPIELVARGSFYRHEQGEVVCVDVPETGAHPEPYGIKIGYMLECNSLKFEIIDIKYVEILGQSRFELEIMLNKIRTIGFYVCKTDDIVKIYPPKQN